MSKAKNVLEVIRRTGSGPRGTVAETLIKAPQREMKFATYRKPVPVAPTPIPKTGNTIPNRMNYSASAVVDSYSNKLKGELDRIVTRRVDQFSSTEAELRAFSNKTNANFDALESKYLGTHTVPRPITGKQPVMDIPNPGSAGFVGPLPFIGPPAPQRAGMWNNLRGVPGSAWKSSMVKGSVAGGIYGGINAYSNDESVVSGAFWGGIKGAAMGGAWRGIKSAPFSEFSHANTMGMAMGRYGQSLAVSKPVVALQKLGADLETRGAAMR